MFFMIAKMIDGGGQDAMREDKKEDYSQMIMIYPASELILSCCFLL